MSRRHTRTALLAVAALAMSALVAGVGGVAQAAASPELVDDGLWYYSRTGIADAHLRTTGEGITIAVIDVPINPGAPDLVGAAVQVMPSPCLPEPGAPTNEVSTGIDAEHATAIAGILVGTGAGVGGQRGVLGVAPDATVLSYSVVPLGYRDGPPACAEPNFFLGDVIDRAVADGADIISLSTGGSLGPQDGRAMARAYAAGVIIVAAAPNEGGPLTGVGNGNGVVAVEMFDATASLEELTTRDEFLTVVAPGADLRVATPGEDGSWTSYRMVTGTSLATPWVAGVLALGWSLYPEATGNQMIQSLVRNTATESPDLTHDEQWGYGAVSVPRFLDADPTRYPDENPLIRPRESELDTPPTSVILAALDATGATAEPSAQASEPATEPSTEPSAEPAAEPTGAPDVSDDGAGSALPMILGGAAVLLLAAVAITVAGRRRSQHSPAPSALREDP